MGIRKESEDHLYMDVDSIKFAAAAPVCRCDVDCENVLDVYFPGLCDDTSKYSRRTLRLSEDMASRQLSSKRK